MTSQRLNLFWRHLNLYSLLAPFRDDVSYLYVVFQHAMGQTTFEFYHFLFHSLDKEIYTYVYTLNTKSSWLIFRSMWTPLLLLSSLFASSFLAKYWIECLPSDGRKSLRKRGRDGNENTFDFFLILQSWMHPVFFENKLSSYQLKGCAR